MLFFLRKSIIFLVESIAICIVNKLPRLDLIVLGLYSSVLELAIINPSIPAASAVLKRAPIFPGFSGDSTMSM